MAADAIPTELRAVDRWVLWGWHYDDGRGAWTKPPYRVGPGTPASSTDPRTWATFDAALAAYRAGQMVRTDPPSPAAGIGFVLTDDDDLAGIDLDHCIDQATGEWEPRARAIVEQLDSYTETSPSGTGLRIIVRARLPQGRRKRGNVECYETGRYLTITGAHVTGTPAEVRARQDAVDAFHAAHLGEQEQTPPPAAVAGNGHAGYTPTDADVLAKARAAANGAKFAELYAGADAGYPSASEADAALCGILAFYTRDRDQIRRIVAGSDRKRGKWARDDYAWSTIDGALARCARRHVWPTESSPDPSAPVGRAGPGSTKGRRLTEPGNAERLNDRHGDTLHYVPRLRRWYVWDGRRWAHDVGAHKVRALCLKTVRAIATDEAKAAADDGDDDRYRDLLKHALKSEAVRAIDAMEKAAPDIDRLQTDVDAFDANPWLLNVANGTVNLRSGELREHRRDDLLTKLAPVAYDPDAFHPLWDKFIADTFAGKDGLAEFVQRAAGYSLTGMATEKMLLFGHGGRDGGKSTFADALGGALGDYAATASFDTFLERRFAGGNRDDLARLPGVRFLASVEVEDGRKLAAGLVKTMTGGDTITAAAKWENEFTYRPHFTLWLFANDRPRIRAEDSALWARIHVVPFDNLVPEGRKDSGLKIRLRDPADGGPATLAWAVRGCLEWQRRGLDPPACVRAAGAAYRHSQDPVDAFADEMLTFHPDAWEATAWLYDTYKRWAQDEGIAERERLSRRAFTEALKRRDGVEPGKREGTAGLRGVTLGDAP